MRRFRKLKIEEVISRLRDLKEHCNQMADQSVPGDDFWEYDAVALEVAIECLEVVEEVEQ